MFGAGQAAVAKAVIDSVEEGVIAKGDADDLLVIVSVFIHWEAKDKQKIYEYNLSHQTGNKKSNGRRTIRK